MAQRHLVQLVDDLDGSDAVKTVTFGVNGHDYEIDLSADNFTAFEQAISRYLSVARTSSSVDQPKWVSLAAAAVAGSVQEPAPEEAPEAVFDGTEGDMRIWAQRKHMVVRPRARIPREIEHAYSAARERLQRVHGT